MLQLRTAVRKVEAAGGNCLVQLEVGVRNGCAIAAADINAVLVIEGNVRQKGNVKNAFLCSLFFVLVWESLTIKRMLAT